MHVILIDKRNLATYACVTFLFFAPLSAYAQFGILGGALGGGAIGGAIGGITGGGKGSAGAIIGVAMGVILQELSAREQQSRQSSLQRAARSGSSSWSSKGKKGSYKKVGSVEEVGGKRCQKVRETITLADGKQGTSEEKVCFS